MQMTEQTKFEIIKAFAYGKTAKEVSEVTGMSLDEAKDFERENEDAILEKMMELKEAGYIE